MKYIKYLLIIMLIFSFAMVSCKKDSTTGPAGGSIVGIWNVVNAIGGWVLTTNSNQEAFDIFDTSGQINISGTHTGAVTFMMLDYETNPPTLIVFDIVDGDLNFMLVLDGATREGTFMVYATSQIFFGNVTFTFDGTTLTVTQSTIQDVASAATVTISGQLSYNKTNIPANTPTLIQWPDFGDGGGGPGFTTIEFKSDGTAMVTDVFDGETDTENWTYTTNDNQVTVIDEDNETMTFEYTIAGNNMTWTSDVIEDPCDGSATQAECFEEWEEQFNLTAGSLTNIIITVEIGFSKAVAKPGLNIGKTYNLMNSTKTIEDYKLKIKRLKESL
jgi:hypothetical protein